MILLEARESDLVGVAGAFDEGRASRNEVVQGVAIRAVSDGASANFTLVEREALPPRIRGQIDGNTLRCRRSRAWAAPMFAGCRAPPS